MDFINNDKNQNNSIYNKGNTDNSANTITSWTVQQSLTAPYELTDETMNNSRKSKAAVICINNNANLQRTTRNMQQEQHSHHQCHMNSTMMQWRTQDNPRRWTWETTTMTTGITTTARNGIKNNVVADFNINNNDNRNKSIYNRWNTKTLQITLQHGQHRSWQCRMNRLKTYWITQGNPRQQALVSTTMTIRITYTIHHWRHSLQIGIVWGTSSLVHHWLP